jgi:hypothetical protein
MYDDKTDNELLIKVRQMKALADDMMAELMRRAKDTDDNDK